ncbi:interleukin-36 beta [Ictidomys tridecemlineatus]|uniref:interleukin-36 beta n=1 Tax=Ictidomys tridecemlineatus TaxID=43179 RepID=UPI00038BE86A|nr:interleukin-36 beta [Ictidomys tridecemlineatus]KAG3268008.1 interleukin 36, beta [Ictidomys tridecemlineatus]
MSSSSPPRLEQPQTGSFPPPHTPVPNTSSSEDPMFTPELQDMPVFYTIRDSQQMVWVLSGDVLIAAPSSNNVQPVTLTLIACRDTALHDEEKGNLVFLGIKGKDLSFCCAEAEGQPTLQLKEVSIMELYRENKARTPFLFFHSLEGSTSAFQSASHPGWFIATSSTAKQPVTLTQERGLANTNFYLGREN